MKKIHAIFIALLLLCTLPATAKKAVKDYWPDGTEIAEWFKDTTSVNINRLGQQYIITQHGVLNDGKIYTTQLQRLIDEVATSGGGVIVVPEGIYMTGALYFRQGVHLHIRQGGVLMGSSDITDFPLTKTRIEGETCTYFPALINADGLNGFTITGTGTIDGNGLTYWRHFWERRAWNPRCTNKDEQRPRLVYVSNCKNVQIEGVNLHNSPFWTTHIYNSENVKLLRLHIFSPEKPVKAPSTDAIDLDVVRNVLIKNCYMSVNDDAVAIKGGKGPYADAFRKHYEGVDLTKYPEIEGDGANTNILIEDCTYGFCHGCLTLGSESVYNHNLVLRRTKVTNANNLLWIKMRPDTPQQYEYITVEDIEGDARNFILAAPWTQFYDLKGRPDTPKSYADHITMRNIKLQCNVFFNVNPQPELAGFSNFTFENLEIETPKPEFHKEYINGFKTANISINGKQIEK